MLGRYFKFEFADVLDAEIAECAATLAVFCAHACLARSRDFLAVSFEEEGERFREQDV